jgi:hypothetical protein
MLDIIQVIHSTVSDLRRPRTVRAKIYALLVPAFAGAGISYMLAPATTLRLVFGRDGGSAGQLLWQLIGSGLHLIPFVSLNLKVTNAIRILRVCECACVRTCVSVGVCVCVCMRGGAYVRVRLRPWHACRPF